LPDGECRIKPHEGQKLSPKGRGGRHELARLRWAAAGRFLDGQPDKAGYDAGQPDDDQHELPAEDLDAEEVDGIAEALGPADQVTAEDVPERLAEDEAELQQREDKWNAQRFEIIDEDRIGAGSVRRGTRADEKAGGDELPEVLREAAQ